MARNQIDLSIRNRPRGSRRGAIADVGKGQVEELDVLLAASPRGELHETDTAGNVYRLEIAP